MAKPSSSTYLIILLFSALFVASNAQVNGCPFDKLYAFGSSDTSVTQASLMASKFHLPPPTPYNSDSDPKDELFNFGASFARPDSTLMPRWFFLERGIQLKAFNHSLNNQLQSVDEILGPYCFSHRRCVDKLDRAVFLFDQLGTNDYKSMFMHGESIMQVSKLVPRLTEAIKEELQIIIRFGAKNIFVSGSPPIGCFPGYLTKFHTADPSHHDSNKCHVGLNTFATLHNDHLRQALSELRSEYPHVRVVYMDYYKAFMALLRNHAVLGFKSKTLMKACCGTGGLYNFNPAKQCGDGAPVCSDPASYIHWDGFGLTQEAQENIVDSLFSGRKFVYPAYRFPEVRHCVM